ncbi:MAG: methionine--tRNA ligase, partial [Flavobacteriales bacterium]|nr:methionine--tRNA ligase [Flavobacteriales bacterium]
KILSAEPVAKTKKLLHLKVDVGIDQRSIVSGIAEYFTPEEVVGKTVSVVVNLAPRNIRGVESQGMILMGESKDGKLAFIAPQEGLLPGDVIR